MTRAGLGAACRGVTHAPGWRRLAAMRPEPLRQSEARTGPPDTGKEVTTHNGGYSGEALRAHSRPPGPGARAGWRPAALYNALCRGYRFGRGAGELREPHWKGGLLRLVRSCDDQEHTPLRQGRERAELHDGWQRCGAEELRDELGKQFGDKQLRIVSRDFSYSTASNDSKMNFHLFG